MDYQVARKELIFLRRRKRLICKLERKVKVSHNIEPSAWRTHRTQVANRNKAVAIAVLSGVFFTIVLGVIDSVFYTRYFSEGVDALYGVKGFYYTIALTMITGAFSVFIPLFALLAGGFYLTALAIVSFFLGSGIAIYIYAWLMEISLPNDFPILLLIVFVSAALMWGVFTRSTYDAIMAPKSLGQKLVFFIYFLGAGIIVMRLAP